MYPCTRKNSFTKENKIDWSRSLGCCKLKVFTRLRQCLLLSSSHKKTDGSSVRRVIHLPMGHEKTKMYQSPRTALIFQHTCWNSLAGITTSRSILGEMAVCKPVALHFDPILSLTNHRKEGWDMGNVAVRCW